METYKREKLYEKKILSIVQTFFREVDSIEDQNVKENFLKDFFGTLEDAQVIREAQEKIPMYIIMEMEMFLRRLHTIKENKEGK